MNLNDQERRLFSSVMIALAALALAALLYWGGFSVVKYFENKATKEKYEIVHKYELIVDSLHKENAVLKKEITKLDFEVDSLESKKNIIIVNYGKKVNIINDASANDHAKWLDSIINKMNNTKR